MADTRKIRQDFSLTRRELGDKYGISVRSIGNWDHRKCMKDYLFNAIYRCEELERDYKGLKEEYDDLLARFVSLDG